MIPADITKRYSGGAANSDPTLSLGGVLSSVEIPGGQGNLFANIGTAERGSGSVKYRCFYFVNEHPTETLANAVVYIASQTPSPGTDIALGLDPAGVGGGAASIPDEDTAPAGVAFSAPSTAGAGLSVGNLAPGASIAVWLRRTTNAGTAPLAADPFTITITGKPQN